MAVNFASFKEKISNEEIKKMEAEYKTNEGTTTYAEVPSGVYPVKLSNMGMGQTSWGADQITIEFTITEGQYKGQKLFYNGSLDTHFAHGYAQTAKLISGMTDGEVDEASILYNITKDKDVADEYLVDLFQTISGALEFDLKYDVKESKKVNPNTNKPYVNRYFSISAVFEV